MNSFVRDCVDELDANAAYIKRPIQTVKDGVQNWKDQAAADGTPFYTIADVAVFAAGLALFCFVVVPVGLAGKIARATS